MSLIDLHSFEITEERGFLCTYDADAVRLAGAWGEAREIAMALPDIMPTGRVRELLVRDLPEPPAVAGLSDAEARTAMVHYSFMVQAYVWGEPEAPRALPRRLACPIVDLADRIGQQPLLPYSGYVLDNWARIDADGPIDLSNIRMIQNFLAGQDEAWFVLVHVAIEARAGAALAAIPRIIAACERDDPDAARSELEAMAGVWADMQAIFERMPERCDPYIYFERVRPYIHGWANNPALGEGIVYEGVERFGGRPQAFRGQTGSQSSIVPSMDALLQVGHAADPLKAFLDELHIYRPPAHRRFIDGVRARSTLRDLVKRVRDPALTDAYNAIVQAVADFRSWHLRYAAEYINKQGARTAGNDTDVGTGGTPFMRYLKKHRDETEARLIRH